MQARGCNRWHQGQNHCSSSFVSVHALCMLRGAGEERDLSTQKLQLQSHNVANPRSSLQVSEGASRSQCMPGGFIRTFSVREDAVWMTVQMHGREVIS